MGQVCLILGGARSGKSRRALQLAEECVASARIFIATAEARDDEMSARIAAHQKERGAEWQTIEEPIALAQAIGTISENFSSRQSDASDNPAAERGLIVVDCLTLWLSNLMHAGVDIDQATADVIAAMKASSNEFILISNEVGLGLVPETPLGRDFRDAQGRLNQAIAAAADVVEFVAAGLPLRLKP